MPAKPQPRTARHAVKPVALSKERRAAIEAQVEQLSAVARQVASELPLSAEASDFLRTLDEAGRS